MALKLGYIAKDNLFFFFPPVTIVENLTIIKTVILMLVILTSLLDWSLAFHWFNPNLKIITQKQIGL